MDKINRATDPRSRVYDTDCTLRACCCLQVVFVCSFKIQMERMSRCTPSDACSVFLPARNNSRHAKMTFQRKQKSQQFIADGSSLIAAMMGIEEPAKLLPLLRT
jgi:hypothetical protein